MLLKEHHHSPHYQDHHKIRGSHLQQHNVNTIDEKYSDEWPKSISTKEPFPWSIQHYYIEKLKRKTKLHQRSIILSGHSARIGSSHVWPAALRGIAFLLVSALCSTSLFARAAFTLSSASGVIVCASLWNNWCACSNTPQNHSPHKEIRLNEK